MVSVVLVGVVGWEWWALWGVIGGECGGSVVWCVVRGVMRGVMRGVVGVWWGCGGRGVVVEVW